MATLPQSIPAAPPQTVGLPDRDLSRATAQTGPSPVSDQSIAKLIAEEYRRSLSTSRATRLTWEKYLMHIDGEGDSQWAEIYKGQRVSVPRTLTASLRKQENLLRIIVANAVAYHTTFPFHFQAESSGDRESKEKALFDSAFVNYMSAKARWNGVFAEALYLAMPAGFCPVHAMTRTDPNAAQYEGAWQEPGSGPGVSRIAIDCFAGDPWTTTFNAGARLNSIHWASYERVVPLELATQLFPEFKLEGSRRMPSSARVQRIARKWIQGDLGTHGTNALTGGSQHEELIAFVCREFAPGVLAGYPEGRFLIIALMGAASADRADGPVAGSGTPVLVHDGPLPAGRFSFVNVYSHHSFDNVYGKPFVGDLSDLQVALNSYITAGDEYLRRASRPALATAASIDADTMAWRADAVLEIPQGGQMPQYLQQPDQHMQWILRRAEESRQAMFRIGGYQAASRGEAAAGDPGIKIQLLQNADKTIHGPTNMRFRESVCDFAQLVHANFKAYGVVPWPIDMLGEDIGDLGQDTICSADLSDDPPMFQMTNAFGVTPEMASQELLQLVTAVTPSGQQLLTVAEFRQRYPGHVFSDDVDPSEVKRQRATGVNRRLRKACKDYAQQNGIDAANTPPEWLQQAAMQVESALAQQYPPLPDDDVQAHYDALSEITQDLTEDALARATAGVRQQRYQSLWAQQAQSQAEAQAQQAQVVAGASGDAAARQGVTQPAGQPQQEAM